MSLPKCQLQLVPTADTVFSPFSCNSCFVAADKSGRASHCLSWMQGWRAQGSTAGAQGFGQKKLGPDMPSRPHSMGAGWKATALDLFIFHNMFIIRNMAEPNKPRPTEPASVREEQSDHTLIMVFHSTSKGPLSKSPQVAFPRPRKTHTIVQEPKQP